MLKRHELSSYEKTQRNFKCTLLSERSQSIKTILYNVNYMRFWKTQNYGDSEKFSSCQGWGEG